MFSEQNNIGLFELISHEGINKWKTNINLLFQDPDIYQIHYTKQTNKKQTNKNQTNKTFLQILIPHLVDYECDSFRLLRLRA